MKMDNVLRAPDAKLGKAYLGLAVDQAIVEFE
jgi:hypothetical protein